MAEKTKRQLALEISASAASFNKTTAEVAKKTDSMAKSSKSAAGNMKKSFGDSSKGVTGALSSMSGGMGAVSGAAGGMTSGLSKMAVGFRVLNAALGPIGLIIAAIGVAVKALSSYFKGSQDGAEKFAKIMGVVKGIAAFVEDLFISLGRAIYKAFEEPQIVVEALRDAFQNFSDNVTTRFEGMGEFIRGFVSKMGAQLGLLKERIRGVFGKEREDEIARFQAQAEDATQTMLDAQHKIKTGTADQEAYDIRAEKREAKQAERQANRAKIWDKLLTQIKNATSIEEKRIALQKLKNASIQEEAKLEREIAEQRLKANDLTLTGLERYEAALAAETATNDLYDIRLEKKNLEAQIAQEIYDLAESNFKDEEALNTILADRDALEAERATKLKAIQLLINKTLKGSESITEETKEQNKLIQDRNNQSIKDQQALLALTEELYGSKEPYSYEQLLNRLNDGVRQIGAGYVVATDDVRGWISEFQNLNGVTPQLHEIAEGMYLIASATDGVKTSATGAFASIESGFETSEELVIQADTALSEHITNIDLFKASWKDAWQSTTDEAVTFGELVQQKIIPTLFNLGTAMGNVISKQKGAWKGLVDVVVQAIGDILKAYLAQAIGAVIATEAKKGIVGLVLAAIGVSALLALWATAVPEFATGMGYVDKPTLAMVGEGATGDYILTPSQLQQAAGGSRNIKVTGSLVADGQDLLVVIQNAENFAQIG